MVALPIQDEATIVTQRKLILAGMKQPWFVLGMLGPLPLPLIPAFNQQYDFLATFARPLLQLYVRALPLILALRDQLVVGRGTTLSPLDDHCDSQNHMLLWGRVLWLAEVCGYYSVDTMQRLLAERYNGKLLDALLGEGFIRESGSGYELCE
jgi:hypothetical protein